MKIYKPKLFIIVFIAIFLGIVIWLGAYNLMFIKKNVVFTIFLEIIFIIFTPYIIIYLIRDRILIDDKGMQLTKGMLFWKENIRITWNSITFVQSGIALLSRANIPLLINYENKKIELGVHLYSPGLLKEIISRIKSDVPVELNKAHQRILENERRNK